jgi:hypothetical protein
MNSNQGLAKDAPPPMLYALREALPDRLIGQSDIGQLQGDFMQIKLL